MPKQITDVDKFVEMSEEAIECRVKRVGDDVKLQLRTARYLYTLVVTPQQAQEIRGRLKCEVVEARAVAEEEV